MVPRDRLSPFHELLAHDGNLIDDRDFGRVADVFTDEVVSDTTDFDMGSVVGIDAIVDPGSATPGTFTINGTPFTSS